MAVEGIVVQIIPQKERDLIARMLLREGTMTSAYVFGGMGGGKNAKPRVFEPGNLLRIETRARTGHGGSETLQTVSEHQLLWQSSHIRHDAKAFALACLYLEMILKTALPHSLESSSQYQEFAGLFNVLSNGLFFLDQALAEKKFNCDVHLLLFLSKFLHHLGVLPDESECVFCGVSLEELALAPLILDQGGFACMECAQQADVSTGEALPVRALLSQAIRTRYQSWGELERAQSAVNVKLIQFWCYHFQIKLPELMSYRMLF